MTPQDSSKYEVIRLSVDTIIFQMREGGESPELNVLLVQRRYPPFEGGWAIPGGFVNKGESLDLAARRELAEETGVKDVYLEQLYTFGEPKRDPRGHVVTVAYIALLPSDREVALTAYTDAQDVSWFSMRELPALAFDHSEILAYARERLENKLEYTTVGFKLLPKKFTLSELQRVYESVLGKELDKRNFRRKIDLLDILDPLDEQRKQGASRPAQLFSLSEVRFTKLRDKGILFPF